MQWLKNIAGRHLIQKGDTTMLPNMKKVLLVAGALLLVTALIPTTAAAQYGRRTFTVFNDSHYRIDHVYVSPNNNRYWGSDQLGRDVFLPGYRFDMALVPGWYDVKLVDQSGYTCVVRDVDFRGGDRWVITDDVLLACEILSSN